MNEVDSVSERKSSQRISEYFPFLAFHLVLTVSVFLPSFHALKVFCFTTSFFKISLIFI